MKRLILAIFLVGLMSSGVPKQASADNTEMLAKTFALTLTGTVAGAYALPYIVPMVAPTVAAAYATVVGTALDGVSAAVGAYIVLEPRMIGAVTGMTAGLLGGLYFFSEEVAEEDIVSKATSNTIIKLGR
jgi:hypothetical protein